MDVSSNTNKSDNHLLNEKINQIITLKSKILLYIMVKKITVTIERFSMDFLTEGYLVSFISNSE